MSTTLITPAVQPRQERRETALAALAAWASIPFLVGQLISLGGLVWDIQWHDDVGPDTFFTAPHSVLYFGVALSGLACALVGGLALVRAGWSGVRRMPAGYLIGGLATSAFLLYGLYDLWWHTVYGFDAVLDSPPHVGLLLSAWTSSLGSLALFVSLWRSRQTGAAALGLALAAAILMATVTPWLWPIVDPLGPQTGNVYALIMLGLSLSTLVLVAAITRRVGAIALTALCLTAIRLIAWFAAPPATLLYADTLGLSLRDDISGLPSVGAMLPGTLLVTGLLLDGLLWFARRQHWPTRPSLLLAMAVVAPLFILIECTQPGFAALRFSSWLVPLVAPLVAIPAGLFGWQIGTLLRQSA